MIKTTLKTCPSCQGKGRQEITVREVNGNNIKNDSFVMDCFSCNGKGKITVQRENELKAMDEAWCGCGNPSGDTEFFNDGESPVCHKHHYTCKDCGKILQIG